MFPHSKILQSTKKRPWGLLMGLAVLFFCGLVLWGAWNTNGMLRILQNDYLRNQALLAASTLELAARDSGGNPADLERRFVTVVEELEIDFAQILLVNSAREIVFPQEARGIRHPIGDQELDQIFQGKKLYVEKILQSGPRPLYQLFLPFRLDSSAAKPGNVSADSLHVLIVILYLDSSDFMLRPGRLNLMLVGIACALLFLFYISGRIFLSRYLALKAIEEEQRRWAILGQMAATLAHEIRNPIGAVKGLAQLLREGRLDSERNNAYLDTIVGESQRLEKLVSDLLVFAKPPQPQKRDFEFPILLEDVKQLFQEKLSSSKVRLRCEPCGPNKLLHSDYELLRRVMVNLVENAIQAMPAGGAITIRHAKDSRGTRIIIEDEGEGLGEETQKIFEPFFTTKPSGTGLGLAISQQIVQALGGTLQLENRKTKGACAIIDLPD
jgi:signal transduction histidine kinase